jgi:hypothetical protein
MLKAKDVRKLPKPVMVLLMMKVKVKSPVKSTEAD